MFFSHIPNKIFNICQLIVLSVVSFKIIVCDSHTRKQLIFSFILVFCIIFIYYNSKYIDIVELTIFILGSKNISFNKILNMYFYVSLIVIIAAMICAKLGFIENLIYFRGESIRQSFGIVYPTNFAAHVFFLILTYIYLKEDKISYLNIIVFSLLALFVYKYCDARLDTISIILSIVTFTYIKFKKRLEFNVLIKFLLTYSIPICMFISIGTTILYKNYSYNDVMIKLDKLLSNRLRLGSDGINMYGYSMFGNEITMKGNGGITDIIQDYFFIDSSYLLITLRYGYIFLCLFILVIINRCKNNNKTKNIKLQLIIALVAINSIVAHHLIDFAYNPFIMMIFTPLEENQLNTKKIKFRFSRMAIFSKKTKTLYRI